MKKLKLGPTLILVGIVLILGAIGLVLYNNWDSARAGQESDRVLGELEDLLLTNPVPVPTAETGRPIVVRPGGASQALEVEDPEDAEEPRIAGENDDTPHMATVQVEEWKYIGVLEFPTLGLRLPVLNRWDYNRLRVAPCRYYGSVYNNNLVICGHNYTVHFSPVRSIALGADVYFTDMTGTKYHYTVINTETVQPMQVDEMIDPGGDWDMTLFTCNIGGATRFACRCRLLDVTDPEGVVTEAAQEAPETAD